MFHKNVSYTLHRMTTKYKTDQQKMDALSHGRKRMIA